MVDQVGELYWDAPPVGELVMSAGGVVCGATDGAAFPVTVAAFPVGALDDLVESLMLAELLEGGFLFGHMAVVGDSHCGGPFVILAVSADGADVVAGAGCFDVAQISSVLGGAPGRAGAPPDGGGDHGSPEHDGGHAGPILWSSWSVGTVRK
jgi:hypothetical protein